MYLENYGRSTFYHLFYFLFLSQGVNMILGEFSLPVVFQEEIEIEGKVLHVREPITVISVKLRKKATGKLIAEGRHTKYLPASSKL